jgi:hypothetical protein
MPISKGLLAVSPATPNLRAHHDWQRKGHDPNAYQAGASNPLPSLIHYCLFPYTNVACRAPHHHVPSQLFVLFVLMMAEAVTVSVLFPFVPFMVRDFHVADTDEKVCSPPDPSSQPSLSPP